MKIQFLGAAQNVTGSKFFLETSSSRILIDCGMFQERSFRERNWNPFPVDPRLISHVLLTHAHVDHCGYLPKLFKEGFRGEVICTEPTAEIAQIVLMDSAHLQEMDAAYKKKRHKKENRAGPFPEEPLYTVEDAQRVLPSLRPVDYKQEVQVTTDIKAVFHDAGHILGASMIEFKVQEGGGETTIIFSGDIGRWDRPILCDPTLFEKADYVVMESTYGDRIHEKSEDSQAKFLKVISRTKKRGGNIVIPTFAIERAQELLYDLDALLREKKIPHLPVFVDSPMANKVTEVFKKHWDYMDSEMKQLKKTGETLFTFPLLKATNTTKESKEINEYKGTAIILAGSGMCTGGRIKHHLKHNISRPESTVLFVGYQAHGTLGRVILEKPQEVRIHGQHYPLKAEIERIEGFSAHAGQDDLLKWVSSFKEHPKKIFIVHGEKQAQIEFAQVLEQQTPSPILIPEYLQTIEL